MTITLYIPKEGYIETLQILNEICKHTPEFIEIAKPNYNLPLITTKRINPSDVSIQVSLIELAIIGLIKKGL